MIKISVSIDVSNLKQAETFYIEALDCKKLRDQGKSMSVISTENCDIYLQEKKEEDVDIIHDKILVTVEPSIQMINQRPKHSGPVTQGCTERLPFKDASFTHSMTVLSMHHWTNRKITYEKIKKDGNKGQPHD